MPLRFLMSICRAKIRGWVYHRITCSNCLRAQLPSNCYVIPFHNNFPIRRDEKRSETTFKHQISCEKINYYQQPSKALTWIVNASSWRFARGRLPAVAETLGPDIHLRCHKIRGENCLPWCHHAVLHFIDFPHVSNHRYYFRFWKIF